MFEIFNIPDIHNENMKHGEGFILVYSINSRETFERVQPDYYNIILQVKGGAFPAILVGNKCDLEDQREVTTSEGEQLAMNLGIPFMESSAKLRLNIEEMMEDIASEVFKFKGLVTKKGKDENKCALM